MTDTDRQIDLETMRRTARAAGFAWSDAELEAIRPAVEALRAMLARLDSVPLDAVEPTTQYRVL